MKAIIIGVFVCALALAGELSQVQGDVVPNGRVALSQLWVQADAPVLLQHSRPRP